ncbi:E3 ubiquitin-protein ligase RNF168 [Hyla sarda]|uniref:E3 ubiquitin-protein ligase RNF168 n=1 Tax=Hyla sarda TaxID=327740 RepID=UPI0024C28F2C|nr:E3 ubiquitin-protein ligase RNF168 [Hyla sarda]XP_056420427.1 E3 ubiquitin-protein ligase RNF168 [Hyla sarda]XP_056420428.1 E3 ubiquitin-protein ligase RNF168 [Hyla sarda]XP_056420429.1 E3 ubiquitin-protein ligase RNF168 [Hyla sarda]XP_056420430.1 E3 ubiquitin-protein ligase RNF168 [Hyla sarda]XP_056420431.1 E3 ubiquitin-protein ligase RNF168 [Hyla sarda]XP_056420432.1 E3 ubiquitin-protein ligase RNF168 [Hyla sarda]
MSKKRKYPLTRLECICGICREILLEPVTLPCGHTLCHPCFQLTVEKASLCCPYCRKRVSNWARKNARSGTLVDTELWEIIQRQYPEECERRARGQDTVEDDFEDGLAPYPIPHICKPGEIRQEYEAEINKIKAEQLSREEEESRASEEYIRKLLAEEEEEQRAHIEYLQRQLDEQLKRDEELARTLSSDLNESTTSEQSSILEIPVVSRQTPSSKASKSVKAKPKVSGDIERFLSPKAKQSIHSFPQMKSEDLKSINSSACVSDSEGESMPSLSPQFSFHVDGRKMHDSDAELPIPCLSKYSPTDAAENGLQLESSYKNSAAKSMVRSKIPSDFAAIDLSPPMTISGQSDCGGWSSSQPNHGTSTPEKWVKTAAKRALESPKDGECHTAEKRQKVSCMENSSVAGLHAERLMELEETLTQRKMQEEQDRLLALKLQKLLDKEQSTVSRHKGSPDEYKLRPKRTSVQQETLNLTPLKMSDSEAESPKSEDTSDENKKPAPKKCMQQPQNRARHSSSRSQVLKPSNKQQTILDMFQRSTEK